MNKIEEQKKTLILIACDDLKNCQDIEYILTKEGYRVTPAKNISQASNMTRNLSPDIIIADIILLETEGPDAFSLLKHEAEANNIQVIILTLENEPFDIVKGFQAGADDYIKKPFRTEELLARIKLNHEIKKNRDIILQYNKELEKERTKLKRITQERANLLLELKKQNDSMKKMIITDDLTELYNHKYVMERLSQEIAGARRYSRDMSIILFDIDRFRQINVSYGHHIGNEALVRISSEIKKGLRKVDIAARYSGDEFLVILPNTDNGGAVYTADRIRKSVEELEWNYEELNVTISGGVSTLMKNENTMKYIRDENLLYMLIMRAENLLFAAKEGMNKIENALSELK
ncbi:MAG: diguanylate cyclase [Desulfobacteraceae bacterium]|nr:diguanylate cyclase [Desulfobacteraceae bacterium]